MSHVWHTPATVTELQEIYVEPAVLKVRADADQIRNRILAWQPAPYPNETETK